MLQERSSESNIKANPSEEQQKPQLILLTEPGAVAAIPATWEAEIWRIMVRGKPWQKS
jgi:hypothetical protein